MVTIFYSWQSDTRAAANRTLIQDALEAAVVEIRDDDSIAIEPVVDRDTLAVNVLGSLLIGLLAPLTEPDGCLLMSTTARQFFMIGVFGGFTTFSSFSLQVLNLVRDGQWMPVLFYIMGSVLLCLIGVWLGHGLGIAINR
jgi:CrcB protein